MKKCIVKSCFWVLAGSLILLGCSKAKDNKTPSNTATGNAARPPGNAAAPASGPAQLQVKWTVGKKYSYQMEIAQNSETPLPGMPKPMVQANKMAFGYSISVPKELPNGGRELEIEFTNVKMEAQNSGRTVLSFDSDKDAASDDPKNSSALVLRRMIGARLKLLADATGKIERVEDFDQFEARLSGNGGAGSAALVKTMFNEDSLKQLCDPSLMLPAKPVSVGDTWPIKTTMKMAPVGDLTFNLKGAFKRWDDLDTRRCARLEFTGNISSKPDAAQGQSPVQIEKDKLSGEVWFDPELGMMVVADHRQEMTLKITTRGNPLSATMTQKTSVRLIEVTDLAK